MTDRSQASSGRDFGFLPSDQAGGASQQHPQQSFGQYDADHSTDAPGASETGLPAHLHDPSMRYQAFGVQQQQQQVPQVPQVPGQYSGYGFSPSAPLGWDWTNSLDFSEFTGQYEPQGELVDEQQQTITDNDFSIPLPVTTVDSGFQASHASNTVTPSPANVPSALSPPPKPPQRPVVQTGVKRKADSELDSAISQTASIAPEPQPNQPKRHNKSRQSSTSSLPSPSIAEPAETRPSPMAQSTIARNASEPTPHGNTELPRRKEQSKGTGPQGRVIDVSRPRRVVESPGGPDMLPAGKVFPIQIGSELFRLSGASISSDGKHSTKPSWPCNNRLRLLEHPHTSRISLVNNYTTMVAVPAT
jgi:hypothetical protein